MCDMTARCHTSSGACVLIGMTTIPPLNPSASTKPTASVTSPIERPSWLSTVVWPFPINTLFVDGPDGLRRVAYTEVGSGPVLLFSHAGQWSFLWRDVIAELSGGFRCIAFDSLGSGLSDRVPAEEQRLDTVRDVIGALIDDLDLRDVTLVMHDLGGVTALAAASTRMDRIAAIAAVNTFGWRPSGLMFRSMLWMIGGAPMRELDAFTGFLPKSTGTRFGVGRHLDRSSRRAFLRGMRDRPTRRTMHRLFQDARRNNTIYDQAAATMRRIGTRPALTVFGSLGDYLRFQKRWRQLVPNIEQRRVPRGIHFPMCDNPTLVARHLREWHKSITG